MVELPRLTKLAYWIFDRQSNFISCLRLPALEELDISTSSDDGYNALQDAYTMLTASKPPLRRMSLAVEAREGWMLPMLEKVPTLRRLDVDCQLEENICNALRVHEGMRTSSC